MGELAIPVLEQRAAAGDQEAVDDLAFIGTPAAAESLAGLICIDEHPGHSARGRTAVTAAWRLAELLTVPDVEEGLKNSRLRIPDGVPSYDWVWKPFALSGTQDGPIGWVVGRAALLIDRNPTFVPQVTHDIDQRIAIPLSVIEAGARVRGLPSKDLSTAAGMSKSQAEHYFLAESRSLSPLSEGSAELGNKIIRELKLPPAHGALAAHLPWPILARLLAALFTGRITTTDERDWLEIQQNPKSARWLWGALYAYLALTILSAIIFASFWQIEVLRSAAHLGARGPQFIYALCFFGGGLCLLLGGFTLWIIFGRENNAVRVLIFFGAYSAPLGVVGDVLVSGWVLGRWLGPVFSALLIVGVVGLTVLLWGLAARRERRYGNPLRQCMQVSDRSFADRTSVIAK